jgi:hypothetical protein
VKLIITLDRDETGMIVAECPVISGAEAFEARRIRR